VRSWSSPGDGLAGLALADRATISNMSPEYGATAAMFPIDDETLTYLRLTGRDEAQLDLVERYAKEQGLWREPGPAPTSTKRSNSTCRPCIRASRARAVRRIASTSARPATTSSRRSPAAARPATQRW
jgi:hypothetical protein